MFEDATFESTGIITTRSSCWMAAVLLFDASLLLILILIPLLHPQALPPTLANLMRMTAPQPEPQTPPQQKVQAATTTTEMPGGVIVAPNQIPVLTYIPSTPERQVDAGVGNWALNPTGDSSIPFGNRTGTVVPIVHSAVTGPVRITSLAAESEIILKTMPIYPPIALAARVEGTVRLAATISKTGSIEDLRVTSGPAMLQQAALNAVSCWRYKPYLLDGQPVEVETTVNVIFTLSR